jgi:hypothetical protein
MFNDDNTEEIHNIRIGVCYSLSIGTIVTNLIDIYIYMYMIK